MGVSEPVRFHYPTREKSFRLPEADNNNKSAFSYLVYIFLALCIYPLLFLILVFRYITLKPIIHNYIIKRNVIYITKVKIVKLKRLKRLIIIQ